MDILSYSKIKKMPHLIESNKAVLINKKPKLMNQLFTTTKEPKNLLLRDLEDFA
jgi:hypothetical protein